MPTAIISAALTAITEGLKLLNTVVARSHIDKVANMNLKILKLESKPYAEQDDAEIVETYKEIQIWIERAEAIIKSNEKA